jgi:methionine synthase I (cobalamin-dependent)
MKKNFRQVLAEELVLADGAMGTLLVSRGAAPEQAKSPLNVSDPEAVREVHEDYADAGARILTTNTWDANRVKLTAHEWADSLEKINREGVRLAREAAAGEMAFVAGSIGPLGVLVKPYGSLTLVQVREVFEEQARTLLDAGVDLILLETFGSLLEAAEAVRAVRGLSAEIPIVAQMTFLSDGRTAFGEGAGHALATLALAGADSVGMNCTLGPQETHDVFTRLPTTIPVPLCAMPNAGYPTAVHGRNVYLSSPDYLREYAALFAESGAAIIGGCCGTTPEHVRAMARGLSGRKRRAPVGPVSPVVESSGPRLAEPAIETSRLKRRLASAASFVVTAEVEPPRGVDVSAVIDGARKLKACGIDGANVTDNPMARLRMSAIAVAALIQREVGLDAVVQITTRDRNVLGLQSDLIGAAALGIKAILCLGGDPLKIGDYPQGKQVSELDVLGLLRMARGLNAGADLAGNAIGSSTAFAVACAINPSAADTDAELARLRARIEAGSCFSLTHPIYVVDALQRFLSRE